MKDKLVWVVAFVVFAVLAFLVDHGAGGMEAVGIRVEIPLAPVQAALATPLAFGPVVGSDAPQP